MGPLRFPHHALSWVSNQLSNHDSDLAAFDKRLELRDLMLGVLNADHRFYYR
jgi:hypothetical protein